MPAKAFARQQTTSFIRAVFALAALSSWAASRLPAQVFEVGGGNSSLYQAGGGTIVMHGKSYEAGIGAGTVDGHFLEGARVLKNIPHGTLLIGDDRVDFRLPTDIFDNSHYVQIRGIGINHVNQQTTLVARVGATSIGYNSPFFNAAKTSEKAGLLFVSKEFNPRWLVVSDVIFAKKLTQIEALQWTPRPKIQLAIAGGVGVCAPFSALSLNLSRPRIDVQAAYIAAGQSFHRIAGASPQLAEPDKDNIAVTVRPFSFMSFGGGRNHYLVPQDDPQSNAFAPQPGFRSSIDQGFTSMRVLGTQLSVTVYSSTYQQPEVTSVSNRALAVSAMRDINDRVHLTANYFRSRPDGGATSQNLLFSFAETLNPRIAVLESITTANGQTSVNFGGEFLSNRFTASATYQTFYVPVQNGQPFEQALLLDVSLRALGRVVLHGSTFVDPVGRLRYTADVNTVLSRTEGVAAARSVPLGQYLMQGCVVDAENGPVEGATLHIDDKSVYTDSTGCFSLRENKPRIHNLRLAATDFLISGDWQADSIPTTITSASDLKAPAHTVIITVHRTHKAPISPK